MSNGEKSLLNSRPNKRFYFNPEVSKKRAREKEARRQEQESFKAKEIKGQNTGYEGSIYTCPLTNQNFKGGCPVIPCHANITSYKTERSCCLYLETGKADFDRWDLQEQLSIKESKVYKLREIGEKKVKNILLFNEVLNELRGKNDENLVPKSFAESSNFIHHSYLKINEINGRHSDVELIKRNIPFIKKFIEKSGRDITVYDLIGLDKPTLLPEG